MPELSAFEELVQTMATLRGAEGCKWDQQQTPESLKPYILEECYELLEAIDRGDQDEICDELGDLLLQVVFQAQIFAEQNSFTIEDVADAINQKLIRRHPHIFQQESYQGHELRWEKIKLEERKRRGQSNRLADRIPSTLPALKRAAKLCRKLQQEENLEPTSQVKLKVSELHEQVGKLQKSQEISSGHISNLLFSIAQLAQAADIDPEDALRKQIYETIVKIDAKNIADRVINSQVGEK